MKKQILALFGFLAVVSIAHSQSFTAAPGFTSTALFTTDRGYSISALDVDANGDIYYLETGLYDSAFDTRLFVRSASDYSTATELNAFGSGVAGSFVRLNGGTVYFGESSVGEIRSIATSGGSHTTIATVPGNYDLRFSGGTAYLSANLVTGFVDPPDNRVYAFNITTGVLDAVLDPGSDYSSPIIFDNNGHLLYGTTGFGSLFGDVYGFEKSALDTFVDADPLVTDTLLDFPANPGDGDLVFDNTNNQYLALLAGNQLVLADSPFGVAATLRGLSLLPGNLPYAIGQTAIGDFFGGLGANGDGAYVSVSADFFSGPSTVFRVVPEPASAFLSLLGLGLFLRRRRE